MKIAIVDDDTNWRERIQARIMQCGDMEIDTFSCGEEFLTSAGHYDISFVDIEMSGMDGFETISKAKQRDEDSIYVILTTHTELSRKGYCVNAFRYIDKAHLEEIDEAIESAAVVLGRNKKIEVNVIGDGARDIVLKNIIYIETEKHYIVVHTRQGALKCNNNLKDIETILPNTWFCRCHNVFIVNLDEILRIDGRIAYLSNGDDIDISYRKMSQFKKLYINRQYECANA